MVRGDLRQRGVRAWAGRNNHGSQLLANKSARRTERGGLWLARGRRDVSLAESAQEVSPGRLMLDYLTFNL